MDEKQRLRQLKRRWKKTGSVEDETAWLRARVEAGGEAEVEVRLLAYDGHEPARLALGDWNDDTAFHAALVERNRRERETEMTAARARAVAKGKEPFDIEALAKFYEFASPEMAKNYQNYADDLEREYYLRWPRIMTLVEFAEKRRSLDHWG